MFLTIFIMKLQVITIPHKTLRNKAKSVDKHDLQKDTMQMFITNLIETMRKEDGIGLAAPQVDHSLRMFVIATEDGAKVFVNPKILTKSWSKNIDEEGCLSIPAVYGTVKRSNKVMIKALDRNGESFLLKANGLLARVIQHENDHLNGEMFIDKVIKITKGQDKLDEMLEK